MNAKLLRCIGIQNGREKCKNLVEKIKGKEFVGLGMGGRVFVNGSYKCYVALLTLRLLMSYIYIYIYGAPILDVSRSHTTTQHSR